jgi:tRNA(Ile)-lysidine synthase
MVLCHLLQLNQIDFSVAHCNFQLRGGDSDKDEVFVREKAENEHLEVYTRRFDALNHAREKKVSVQVAARELRYNWFDELLDQTGSDYLLTAHHADDNLETFLINLSRGSGLKGLTGIPEKNGKIRRPLLPFSREEIEAYAASNKISWREDRSNMQNKYLRNRIRHELIPLMKETIPTLSIGFSSTLKHLKASQSLLDHRFSQTWKSISRAKGELIQIDIAGIRSLEHSKAYLYGLFSGFGFTQWSDIEGLLTAQSGKMVYSDTHRLLKDRDQLLLQRLDSLPIEEQSLQVRPDQKSVELKNGILHFESQTANGENADLSETTHSRNVAILDANRLKFPLVVRKWQKGDYFYPKGMTGKKKLSKFFTDEKLSIPEKENIWLLCARNEIVWVIGRRSDERYNVTDQTKSVLHVEWIPK